MRVENAKVERHRTFLKEKYRPPNKGGNTGALHLHVLEVNGESYSSLNAGSQKFVSKNDTASFELEWDDTRKYRNIQGEIISVRDMNGKLVIRQIGAFKKWRTAKARTPVSRREERG
ncbi:hypothetical protein [Hyphomicrobium sp. ghe19]|uniref:hypothetical protein n=1 Tax=Hyphomicrobium sp. ghe19 TaxID=2682968 RepID=UPI00136728D5|nr:hypothetical protein HYPP_00141 [Hyphomicrobium sp. ghe19]